jgi:branched-chain amino acid transport system ATP-binding protein
MPESTAPVLSCTGMSAGYHGVAAVSELDLEVRAGEVVALVGANGAGKSTTLSVLAGLAKPLSGTVSFLGSTKFEPAHVRARRGLTMVADDRSVLRTLTAEDNLRLGAGGVDTAVQLFPELVPLLKKRAVLLSGGEQQMLSLGRALSKKPAALLADEVSLGLAPQVTQRLHRAIRAAADIHGTAVVLVEQKVRLTMKLADRIVVLRGGRKVLEGAPADIEQDLELLEQQFLGGHAASNEAEA